MMRGGTALHAAVVHGDVDLCKLLLTHNPHAHALCVQDVLDATVLMHAALGHNQKLLKCILDEYVKFNCTLEAVNVQGCTALMLAVPNSASMAQLLEARADVNASNHKGYTVLMRATRNFDGSAVDLLLAQTALKINATTPSGNTALMSAASAGNTHAVAALLQMPGIDVTATDNRGFTALINAARFGHGACIILIAPHIADINISDNFGRTALIWAVIWGDWNFVGTLLDVPGTDVNRTCKDGRTALMIAACEGSYTVIGKLLADPKCRVEDCDPHGWPAVAFAARNNHMSCVNKLLGDNPAEAVLRYVLVLAVLRSCSPCFARFIHSLTQKQLFLLSFVFASFQTSPLASLAFCRMAAHGAIEGACARTRYKKQLFLLKSFGFAFTQCLFYSRAKHGQSIRRCLCFYVLYSRIRRLLFVAFHSSPFIRRLSFVAFHSSPRASHGTAGGHAAIVSNLIARGAVIGTTASLTSSTHVDILQTLANGGVRVFGSSITCLQLWLLCLMTPQVHTRQAVQLQVARADVMDAACTAFLLVPKACRFDVLFLNENGEGDGIRREWLKMAVAAATDPDRGLFSVYGGNMCYPNALSSSAGTDTLEFQMIGKLCGYALFYREPYVRASCSCSCSLRSPYLFVRFIHVLIRLFLSPSNVALARRRTAASLSICPWHLSRWCSATTSPSRT